MGMRQELISREAFRRSDFELDRGYRVFGVLYLLLSVCLLYFNTPFLPFPLLGLDSSCTWVDVYFG